MRGKQKQQQQQPQQQQIGSDFNLGAFLHTGQSLPYQSEMVENYLAEARRRFEAEGAARRRERAEQAEAEERRKREIYLNGGYLECTNRGCEGRGTAETNYQCPICIGTGAPSLANKGKQSPAVFEEGNSKFYVEGVDLSS